MIYLVLVSLPDSNYNDGFEVQEVSDVCVSDAGTLAIVHMREEATAVAFNRCKLYAPGCWSEVCIKPLDDTDE